MPEKTKTFKLTPDRSLTADHFVFNPDGTVTVKNSDLSKFLADNLKAKPPQNPAMLWSVGVTVGN